MKQDQLQAALIGLVKDFGYTNVRKTLSGVHAAEISTTKHQTTTHTTTIGNSAKKTTKPNAMNIVEKLDIADHKKKEILLAMAEQYEAKEFMPNVNHVRDFLDGDRNSTRIKSRQQVTSAVFKKLHTLETMKLQKILKSGFYGTPKRLETYAKAIEGFSRQHRST